jgi:hypothetical protein
LTDSDPGPVPALSAESALPAAAADKTAAVTRERGSLLLRDQSGSLESDDQFAHADYARVLSEVLVRVEGHATIGLFAPWGVGKTSVLKETERRLPFGCPMVIFDAWRYEGTALRRSLLKDLASSLAERELLTSRRFRKYNVNRELRDLQLDIQDTEFRFRLSLPFLVQAVLLAVIGGGVIYGLLQFDTFSEAVQGTDRKSGGLVALVSAVLIFMMGLLAQVFRVAPTAVTQRRVEDPERFTELFERLLGRLRQPRLVIAVDNLDRCSPETALQLLSVIKTYLEVAVDKTSKQSGRLRDVTFVLAVDDEALRRHLLSNELSQAPSPSGSYQAEQLIAAERYVGEYLRKLFTATIQMGPLLAEDIQRYCARQMKRLQARHQFDQETANQLTALVAAGLRRSPRRVIQFINNLQLRLSLIRIREESAEGRPALISPAISDNPLMITKLAILEEEWPWHYRALQASPQLMSEWDDAARRLPSVGHDASNPGVFTKPTAYAQLRGGISLWWRSDEPPANYEFLEAEWADVAAFLRASAGIRPVVAISRKQTENLTAFLNYKLSDEDARLPRSSEFGVAAISGDRTAVAEVVAGNPEYASRYARRSVRLLWEQTQQQNTEGARSIIDVVLTVPELASQAHQVRALLEAALDDPNLTRQLIQLPTGPLLDSGSELAKERFDQLIDALLDQLPSLASSEQRTALAAALAGSLERMSSESVERMRSVLASPSLAEDAVSMLPLYRADPALIGPTVADVTLTRFQQQQQLLRSPEGEQFTELLLLMIGNLETQQLVSGRVLVILPTTLAGPMDLEAALAGIERLRTLADTVEVSDAEWRDFLINAAAALNSVPPALRGDLAEWLWDGLGRLPIDQHEQVKVQLTNVMLGEPAAGLPWISGHVSDLSAEIKNQVAEQVADWPVIDGPVDPLDATRFVSELIDRPSALLLKVAAKLVLAGRPDDAEELLTKHGPRAPQAAEGVLGAALERLRESPHEHKTMDLALQAAEIAGENASSGAVAQLINRINFAGPASLHQAVRVAELTVKVPRGDETEAAIDQALTNVVSQLTAGSVLAPMTRDRLRHLGPVFAAASSVVASDLRSGLVKRMLDDPESGETLIPLISAVTGSHADQEALIDRLRPYELQSTDLDYRLNILRLAMVMGYREYVAARMSELMTSPDTQDREIASRLVSTFGGLGAE